MEQTAAQALSTVGLPVTGWGRSPKDLEGLRTEHGKPGLSAALSAAEILVLLMADTPQTKNLLNAENLDWLPKGVVLINPGRSPLIDDTALLAALATGQIGHATLDVFRTEPCP